MRCVYLVGEEVDVDGGAALLIVELALHVHEEAVEVQLAEGGGGQTALILALGDRKKG